MIASRLKPSAYPSPCSIRVSSGPRCRMLSSAAAKAAAIVSSIGPASDRLLKYALRPHIAGLLVFLVEEATVGPAREEPVRILRASGPARHPVKVLHLIRTIQSGAAD